MTTDIAHNLEQVRSKIVEAAQKCGRAPDEIQLVAVSKTHEAEKVRAAFDAGQEIFGESKVQEARAKIPLLPSALRWHFIGRLQKNKVRHALPLFELFHGVDSLALVENMNRVAEEDGLRPRILLEVNVAGEGSKIGFAPEQLRAQFDQTQFVRPNYGRRSDGDPAVGGRSGSVAKIFRAPARAARPLGKGIRGEFAATFHGNEQRFCDRDRRRGDTRARGDGHLRAAHPDAAAVAAKHRRLTFAERQCHSNRKIFSSSARSWPFNGVMAWNPTFRWNNCAAPVRVQRVEVSRTCLETLRGPMLATVTRVSC